MDKFDRIFHLHAILAARQTPISLEDLMARLECSKATLYRAIAVLKDTLHAPVVFDTGVGGFRYARTSGEGAFELPGLWFNSAELQALALMQRLLKDLGGGLLTEHLGPLSKRLDELTRHRRLNLGEAAGRLRFPAIASRAPPFRPLRRRPFSAKRFGLNTMRAARISAPSGPCRRSGSRIIGRPGIWMRGMRISRRFAPSQSTASGA
jgi:predicted DNA-binding transcriptional regulator YafY